MSASIRRTSAKRQTRRQKHVAYAACTASGNVRRARVGESVLGHGKGDGVVEGIIVSKF